MRDTIPITDHRWVTTLSHLVEPREEENEWLLGLSLRCDLINGWPSGTTASMLIPRSTGVTSLGRPGLFVAGTFFDLDLLAAMLDVSRTAIDGTTFRLEFARLYPGQTTHARRMGVIPRSRVCPDCLREDHLLARWLALPLLTSCPRHRASFEDMCVCGAPLRPFQRDTPPFTCGVCHHPWRDVPRREPKLAVFGADTAITSAYSFLFDRGTPETMTIVHRMLWTEKDAKKKLLLHLDEGSSLAEIAAAIVEEDVDLSIVPTQPTPIVKQRFCCRNQTCPYYGVVGSQTIRHEGSRTGVPAYYCRYCGSRFVGNRIYQSFDDGCSSDGYGPLPQAIAGAKGRLTRWRSDLRAICKEMLVADAPITVNDAFYHAGIPPTRNLRAERLGLVEIAQDHVALQKELWAARRLQHAAMQAEIMH